MKKILGTSLLILLSRVTFALFGFKSGIAKAAVYKCSPISQVYIHPGIVNTNLNTKTIELSALAYDNNNEPIFKNVSYKWGISSSNSIGQLSLQRNQSIAQFIPKKVGYGDIWVQAKNGCTPTWIMKSIPVTVGTIQITPTPTPTIAPTLTPTPTPTPTPAPSSKRVFVTSTTYNGNLGGLSGADAKCQERADSANLSGSWKAWLSDSTVSATDRLNHNTLPYILVNGQQIANDWTDLTVIFDNFTNPLDHAINVYENGATRNSGDGAINVWTNTNNNGSMNSFSCNNWTNSTYPARGIYGSVASIGTAWTNWSTEFCSNLYRLYCFEQ